MGQFQEMLDKINQVERDGFNPMTESYSSRIGKLEVTVTPDDDPLTGQSISKSFTDIGYEDPLASLITPEGTIDPSGLSTAYNRIIDDPSIGVDPNAFIGFLNQNYPQELSTTYFPDAQLKVNPDKTLGFPKKETPVVRKNFRFERAPSQSQKRGASDIFLRIDQDTGESKAFDTEEAFDKAREEYKSITGLDVKTGKKEE